jgi:hypothetical protein
MNILSKIKRGDSDLPPRIVLAGPEGIGKSTFGSKAPNPLFVSAEDGLTGLEHVARFTPTSLEELYAFLDAMAIDSGGYKTLVLDTADWLERFVAAGMCKRDGQENIEAYGYGKGFTLLEAEMVKILQKLDAIRLKKVIIIILSHVNIRTFTDPSGPSWDRYEMKGHKKITGLLREWPDACLFAIRQVFKKKEKTGKETAIGGERVIHTTWSTAWDAKNRLNLPETLDLDWDAFAKAVKENSPAALREQVRKLFGTAKLEAAEKAKWDKWIATVDTQSPDKIKAAIEKLESHQ